MESPERSIRQIHSPPSIGSSTRFRNSALTWKDRVSNSVPAVASTPRRHRGCAAPCCSPIQTSVCELTSRLSRWFIRGPVIGIEADTYQRKYEYTLAGTRACSENVCHCSFRPRCSPSVFRKWECGALAECKAAESSSASRSHLPPSRHTFVQALRTTPTLTFTPAVTGEAYGPRFVERVSAVTPVPWGPSGGEMLLRALIKGKIESVTGGIIALGDGPVRLHPRVSDSFFDLSDGRGCLN